MIANISRMDQHIENQKNTWSTTFHPLLGEKNWWILVHKLKSYWRARWPTQLDFFQDTIFRPLGVLAPQIFTRPTSPINCISSRTCCCVSQIMFVFVERDHKNPQSPAANGHRCSKYDCSESYHLSRTSQCNCQTSICFAYIDFDIRFAVFQDGVYLLSLEPPLIDGYTNAILTPNVVEFARLYSAVVRSFDSVEACCYVLLFSVVICCLMLP